MAEAKTYVISMTDMARKWYASATRNDTEKKPYTMYSNTRCTWSVMPKRQGADEGATVKLSAQKRPQFVPFPCRHSKFAGHKTACIFFSLKPSCASSCPGWFANETRAHFRPRNHKCEPPRNIAKLWPGYHFRDITALCNSNVLQFAYLEELLLLQHIQHVQCKHA